MEQFSVCAKSHVEQEVLTPPEQLSSFPVSPRFRFLLAIVLSVFLRFTPFVSSTFSKQDSCCSVFSFLCSVLQIIVRLCISFLLADSLQLIASGYVFGYFRLVLLVIDIDHIGQCKSNKCLKGWLRDVIPCFQKKQTKHKQKKKQKKKANKKKEGNLGIILLDLYISQILDILKRPSFQ